MLAEWCLQNLLDIDNLEFRKWYWSILNFALKKQIVGLEQGMTHVVVTKDPTSSILIDFGAPWDKLGWLKCD